jgi:hypothetical protein
MDRTRSIFLLLVPVLFAVAASGCGDADGDATVQTDKTTGEAAEKPAPPSQAYLKVLRELKTAAGTGETYKAVRHARNLSAPERAAIVGFCETTWQLDVNKETSKLSSLSYTRGRIESRAGVALHGTFGAAPPQATLTQLEKVIDLSAFDAEVNRRYKRACYS